MTDTKPEPKVEDNVEIPKEEIKQAIITELKDKKPAAKRRKDDIQKIK